MAAEALMGFLTGFAKTAKERVEKEREDNEELIASRLKMAATAGMVRDKEMAAKKAEAMQRRDFIESVAPNASIEQKLAVLGSSQIYESLKSLVDRGEPVELDELLVINKDKIPKSYTTVNDYMEKRFAKPVPVPEEQMQALTGGKGFLGVETGVSAGRAEKLAKGYGRSARELLAYENLPETPEMESFASFDVAALKKKENDTVDTRIEDASTQYFTAADRFGENSPEAKDAKDRVDLLNLRKEKLSPKQAKWADNMDRLKLVSLKGSPAEKAAAEAELEKAYAIMRREKERTKIAGEGGDEKIPTAGTMTTILGASMKNALTTKYGGEVGKSIIINTDAMGNSSIAYTGNKPEMRDMVNKTAQEAAINAASAYIDRNGKALTNGVATALRASGVEVKPDGFVVVPTIAPPTPAAPATPQETGRASLMSPKKTAPVAAPSPKNIIGRFNVKTGDWE